MKPACRVFKASWAVVDVEFALGSPPRAIARFGGVRSQKFLILSPLFGFPSGRFFEVIQDGGS